MTTAWFLVKIASHSSGGREGGTAAGQNHLLLTDCCASARVHNHVSFICCFGQNEIKMFASPQHEVKTSELSALLGKAFFRWWVFLATYYYTLGDCCYCCS